MRPLAVSTVSTRRRVGPRGSGDEEADLRQQPLSGKEKTTTNSPADDDLPSLPS